MIQKTHNFMVGDVITAYHKGYHVVIEIVPGIINVNDMAYDTLRYQQIAKNSGKLVGNIVINSCHVAHCKKMTRQRFEEDVADMFLKLHARVGALTELFKTYHIDEK